MNMDELLRSRRTIRRFQQKPIPEKWLFEFVDVARYAPSDMNIQPCEYIIINNQEKVKAITQLIAWDQFTECDRTHGPTAYIVVLIDFFKKRKGGELDAASAVQYILLSAHARGVGTHWITRFQQKKIKKLFRIPHHIHVNSLVALGWPMENPVVEEAQSTTHLWKDEKGIIHVPKRRLADICYLNGYLHSDRHR